jgi:N utilization substance protein B
MALPQQKFREIVFQLLYSHELFDPDNEVMMTMMMGELAVSKRNVRLALERVSQIEEKLSEIDRLITTVSVSYEFERIQAVTLTILRLGVFEIYFDDQVPPKVAIAEAMRLSRKFNTPESASFVNALLDNLYHAKIGDGQIDPAKVKHLAAAMEHSEALAAEEALRQKESSLNSLEQQEDET